MSKGERASTIRVTGEVSDAQSAYFENVIAQCPNVRWTFLFMQKPVWQREGTGNLERIEAALSKRNYTLFNGHFHKYGYTERNGKDYIMMGTTGGGQDQSSKHAFDHITPVTIAEDQPSIVNVRLDGCWTKRDKYLWVVIRYVFRRRHVTVFE